MANKFKQRMNSIWDFVLENKYMIWIESAIFTSCLLLIYLFVFAKLVDIEIVKNHPNLTALVLMAGSCIILYVRTMYNYDTGYRKGVIDTLKEKLRFENDTKSSQDT